MTLFTFENGSNPYIAKTEKEERRVLNKYTRAGYTIIESWTYNGHNMKKYHILDK